MANYYQYFSVYLPLPNKAAVDYAVHLVEQVYNITPEKESPADFPASLKEVVEDWSFETEGDDGGLWLHTENGGVDAACAFIQHLLQQFAPEDWVTLEWSNGCDKPRDDAYGGGAAFITAQKIEEVVTATWVKERVAEFEMKRK